MKERIINRRPIKRNKRSNFNFYFIVYPALKKIFTKTDQDFGDI